MILRHFKLCCSLLAAVLLSGCIPPEELQRNVIGSWSGADAESRICLEFNAEERVKVLVQERTPVSEKITTSLREGSWSVADGGRITLRLETVHELEQDPDNAAYPQVDPESAVEQVIGVRYVVVDMSEDVLTLTELVMGGNYKGNYPLDRRETCSDLPSFALEP